MFSLPASSSPRPPHSSPSPFLLPIFFLHGLHLFHYSVFFIFLLSSLIFFFISSQSCFPSPSLSIPPFTFIIIIFFLYFFLNIRGFVTVFPQKILLYLAEPADQSPLQDPRSPRGLFT
jgi:hypothetical protein